MSPDVISQKSNTSVVYFHFIYVMDFFAPLNLACALVYTGIYRVNWNHCLHPIAHFVSYILPCLTVYDVLQISSISRVVLNYYNKFSHSHQTKKNMSFSSKMFNLVDFTQVHDIHDIIKIVILVVLIIFLSFIAIIFLVIMVYTVVLWIVCFVSKLFHRESSTKSSSELPPPYEPPPPYDSRKWYSIFPFFSITRNADYFFDYFSFDFNIVEHCVTHKNNWWKFLLLTETYYLYIKLLY